MTAKKSGHIYVGIGGWNYEPWRGVFYPKGLVQAKELEYAASRLTSIEINSTFYGSQKPESFRKWAGAVPDGFVFSVKGPRFATNRRVLAEAGDSIKRFLNSGVLELGDRLGPLLWQFAPTKKFDAADFGKFLELLPAQAGRNAPAPRGGSAARKLCAHPLSLLCCASSVRRSCSPITRPSRRSPTCRAISSMRACKKARTRSRPPIRRRNRCLGPTFANLGSGSNARRSAAGRSGPCSRKKPRRATSSPTSFTKAKSARRRRRWR